MSTSPPEPCASTEFASCLVPMVERGQAPDYAVSAFDSDQEREHRVKHVTRVVASSPSVLQTVVRSLHTFVTLRRIDSQTCALLCLYTSLLNGCRYCIDDTAGAALGDDLTPQALISLSSPATSGFDALTISALRFAEAVVRRPTDIPDEIVFDIKRHVDDEELLEITSIVSMKCYWNHLASSLAIPPEGRCSDPELFRTLCDLSDQMRIEPGRTLPPGSED